MLGSVLQAGHKRTFSTSFMDYGQNVKQGRYGSSRCACCLDSNPLQQMETVKSHIHALRPLHA